MTQPLDPLQWALTEYVEAIKRAEQIKTGLDQVIEKLDELNNQLGELADQTQAVVTKIKSSLAGGHI